MAMIYRTVTGIAVVLAVLLSGCNSHADTKDPETMYDIASELKDISTSVQGLVKYGNGNELSESNLILQAIDNDESRLEIFSDYTLRVRVDGQRSSVLLCDDDIALIEDSGCTPEVDLHHWNTDVANQCSFVLNLDKVCD
ncbi:hypothetical protein SAMN06297229_0259 [Pseudidiomarina planktonica]|uniref:Uncharacterized protein n=1 Tax=Pseudidiomarina planktonica TaxID=1323738 RepID=A0A1Y6EFM2_9GAMM|nr:hypothetical protein [Pseudidiomarina planktonica]RUO66249.1 hypothetical protein CWI77_07460 [Pseudidiomarina planktonica]SMQ59392.1 hypothetical protein SAMN06297229_0259 [Pseudidiomarina planktonica]